MYRDASGHMSLMETGLTLGVVGILSKMAAVAIPRMGGSESAANRAEGFARIAFAASSVAFFPNPTVAAIASDEAAAGLRQVFSGKRESTLVAQSVLMLGGNARQAEFASASVQMAGPFVPTMMAKANQLFSFVRAMETQFVSGQGGVTVLGKYPTYIDLAKNNGWNALNVPQYVWKTTDKLPGGFWAWINRPFLDAALMRADKLILSNPASVGGGGFLQELEYLSSKGFNPANVGAAGEELVILQKPAI